MECKTGSNPSWNPFLRVEGVSRFLPDFPPWIGCKESRIENSLSRPLPSLWENVLYVTCFLSAFLEDVFVLRVASDQRLLRTRADRKFKAAGARCHRNEGNRVIGILARGHFAFPLAKIKDRRSAGRADLYFSQRRIRVVFAKSCRFFAVRRNGEQLAIGGNIPT